MGCKYGYVCTSNCLFCSRRNTREAYDGEAEVIFSTSIEKRFIRKQQKEEYYKQQEEEYERAAEAYFERKEKINAFFHKVSEKFNPIELKCGNGIDEFQYIIEVSPKAVFENEEYIKMEYDFSSSFKNEYPKTEILFIQNASLIKIIDPILKINK